MWLLLAGSRKVVEFVMHACHTAVSILGNESASLPVVDLLMLLFEICSKGILASFTF